MRCGHKHIYSMCIDKSLKEMVYPLLENYGTMELRKQSRESFCKRFGYSKFEMYLSIIMQLQRWRSC